MQRYSLFILTFLVTVVSKNILANTTSATQSSIQNINTELNFSKDNNFATFDFLIPAETVSFEIQVYNHSSGLLISELIDPLGSKIVGSLFDPSNLKSSVARNSENPENDPFLNGYASVLVPNNPKTKMQPGLWKAKIKCQPIPQQTCANVKATSLVVIKKYSGLLSQAKAVVPLRLHFSGGRGLSAASSVANAEFKSLLVLIEKI